MARDFEVSVHMISKPELNDDEGSYVAEMRHRVQDETSEVKRQAWGSTTHSVEAIANSFEALGESKQFCRDCKR